MPNCILAEGCIWNRNEGSLYFTDIEGCRIYQLFPSDGSLRVTEKDARVGCMVLHQNGGIVMARTNQLIHWNEGAQTLLLEQQFPSYLRYNDGKCDCYGNLWVGTMAIDQNHPNARRGGSLFCIRNGEVKAAYEGYTIPNGLAWSKDNQKFYHIDTARGEIEVYDIEEQWKLRDRRTLVRINPEEGSPDGMCMDDQGNLWVAMWGGSRINGYDTSSGKKIEEIQIPDLNVTCCCFGGETGKQLFVTTARDENENGGQIYAIEMPVAGAEVYEYGGGTT